MLLKDLLPDIELTEKQKEINISGISIKIEEIKKGDLFIDLHGDKNLNVARERGAEFILCFGNSNTLGSQKVIYCDDIREKYALISKRFYSSCCDKLKVIGITGTNGKSSTVKLVYDLLKWKGEKVGMIGTCGGRYDDNIIETGFTTPDPHILHRLFYQMYLDGIKYVVMEVSAHAIELKKIEGIKFEVIALTNITQDHLDFFENMENYANAKKKLFDKKYAKLGLFCIDDEVVREKLSCVNIPLISYGVDNPSDIFAIDIETDFSGSKFICNCLDEIGIMQTRLVGKYNVLNCLCAIGICNLCGMDILEIACAIKYSDPEIGRFNIINYDGINIVIDYAHTPDGLEKVLNVAKQICEGKLNLLFGCGGNRDKTKRRIMGEIADKYADEIYLTNDNPRKENPIEIVDEIAKGIEQKKYHIELDRRIAIYQAISQCQKGDCLIIAGKGGENYQEINGEKIAYSDFDEVYKFFRNNITLINKG